MSPTKTPTTLLNAVSEDYLVALFRESLRNHATMPPLDLRILNESVRDFLARNAGPLGKLLQNEVFVELHVLLTRELLLRAHELAPEPEIREWIVQQADKLGFEELLPTPSKTPAALFTPSQTDLFERLHAMALLHFRGSEQHGVQLRTCPLIVGPSGIGKSHLVARLGPVMGLEVMRLTVSDWIVSGARAEPQTLRHIQRQLKLGKKFVLHLDELDKIRGHNEAWSQSQLTEMFNVLDRRLSGQWTEVEIRKLRTEVFIVGSGTWQEIWRKQTAPQVGFIGSTDAAFDFAGQVRKANIIPPELLNRFNEDWLVLEPLGVADFERIAATMNLGPAVLDPVKAAASGLNFRAVENALTNAALEALLGEMRKQKELSSPPQLSP